MKTLGPLILRADATPQIGAGHVMRCLALAQAWRDRGGRAVFALTAAGDALVDRLQSERMAIIRLNAEPGSVDDAEQTAALAAQIGASWTVVDGYHFHSSYHRALKAAGIRLLAIDDYGSAERCSADLVLNQNLRAEEGWYPDREPYTRLLLGTSYVLLRREFLSWQSWERRVAKEARRLLVTLGGSDSGRAIVQVAEGLQQLSIDDLEAVLVTGAEDAHADELQAIVDGARFSISLTKNVVDTSPLMAWADVAIIAAGGTLWELLYMQSAVLSYARNPFQEMIVGQLDRQRMVVGLGDLSRVEPEQLAAQVEATLRSEAARKSMAAAGRTLVDGKGAARVVEALAEKGESVGWKSACS
ncbi:MAG: UDP-2,4-diacetamido-2,4,6-trideoxy-beta-L-altropyranose hydrolase [Candidatus Binatia bacterium]